MNQNEIPIIGEKKRKISDETLEEFIKAMVQDLNILTKNQKELHKTVCDLQDQITTLRRKLTKNEEVNGQEKDHNP